MAVAAMTGSCEADLIKVGGKQGWRPDVNYTEWAMSEDFYVGDWLCKFSLSLSLLVSLYFFLGNQTYKHRIEKTNSDSFMK